MSEKIAEGYVQINARLAPLEKSLDRLKGKLQSLTSMKFNLPTGGLLQALGLGAGAFAASKAIRSTVMGAADLAETMSKVGVVFGDQASVVTSAADQMAKAFGVPKREFLDAASQFGLIATGSGLAEKEAAAMSATLAKLAADASSFYNVPVDVALEKIRAGLTGESEPLKAFGVLMDETAVKAQAVAMGLAREGQELNNQAKFLARNAIITRGLASAQGDLERTSGGAANQARMFWGQLQTLGDTIGTALMPAFTSLLNLLNEVASNMVTAAEQSSGAWTSFVSGLKSAIEAAGVIYRNWGDIVENTKARIAESMMSIVERVVWVGKVITTTFQWSMDNAATIFLDAIEAIKTALSNLGSNFMNFGKSVYDWIASGFSKEFEFKVTPVLEGFKAKTTPLQLPEMNNQLSSFARDLKKASEESMQKREDERADEQSSKKKGGLPGANGRLLNPTPGESAGKGLKSEFVGLADFAKKIQSGSLDKNRDKAAKDTAQNTAKALGFLETIANKPLNNGPGMAVGPA